MEEAENDIISMRTSYSGDFNIRKGMPGKDKDIDKVMAIGYTAEEMRRKRMMMQDMKRKVTDKV